MKVSTIAGVAFMLVMLFAQAQGEIVSPSHVDQGRPEPVLFLLEAADAMRDYRARTGSYAQEWHQLPIEFANGPFRADDPGTRPTAADRQAWRPKGCAYEYWITEGGRDHFIIQARNAQGLAAYEIRENEDGPRALLPDPSAKRPMPSK